MQEQWKAVVGYEGYYEVSNHGRVKRVKVGRGTRVGKILKPNPNSDGYDYVHLCVDQVRWAVAIQLLVIEAFVGPRPEGENIVCNHGDGNKKNNHDWNLEWITRSEDVLHAMYVLGKGVGPTNSRSKHYVVTSPDGEEFKVHGLRHFCKPRRLHASHLREYGKYQGWTCRLDEPNRVGAST